VAELDVAAWRSVQLLVDKGPRTHVLRLFLEPDNLSDVGKALKESTDGVGGPRVDLLNSRNSYVVGSRHRRTVTFGLVTNLARCEHESGYGGIVIIEVANDRLERSLDKFVEW
jgi:hypothetical protein